MPPTHSAARTPSQAPLGWGRVPPCTGPRRAGLPKNTHSHYHGLSSTSARRLRAPLYKPQVRELLRPCSCWLRCLVRAWIRKRGAPRGRPLQRWRSFCLRLRARDVGNNIVSEAVSNTTEKNSAHLAQSGAPLSTSHPPLPLLAPPLPLLGPKPLLYSGLASADVLQRGRPLTPKPPLPTGSRLREEGRSRKRSKAGYLGTRIVPVLRATVRGSAEGGGLHKPCHF